MNKLERVLKAVKKSSAATQYNKYLSNPVDEKAFLLEAGQGKHINGNVFALLSCIREQKRFDDYKVYLVVVDGIQKDANKKLKKYGISNVNLVIRLSDEYNKALASSKYLITDNSFPQYMYKREEQVYLNTWHGTPLKVLGRSDIEASTSIGNVQGNFLKADYLLHPNKYCKETMMKDYMVERLYSGKVLTIDYPRNDALFRDRYKDELISKFNPEGKRIVAYMPTWRGTGRSVNLERELEIAKAKIHDIESALDENDVLFVNLHFLLGNKLNLDEFTRVRFFPAEYETYDFMSICDVLISDYSSVSIDYAQTGREVILYMYDYEEYLTGKGFYFDIRELPFAQTYTPEELRTALHNPTGGTTLDRDLCGNNFGEASKKVISLMVDGIEDGLELDDYSGHNDTQLVYVGSVKRPLAVRLMQDFVENLEDKTKVVLAFESKITANTSEVLRNLDPEVDYFRIVPGENKNFVQRLSTKLYRDYGLMKSSGARYYKQEARRIYSCLNYDRLVLLGAETSDRIQQISFVEGKTAVYDIPAYFMDRNNRRVVKNGEKYRAILASAGEVIEYPESHYGKIAEGLRMDGIFAHFIAPHSSYSNGVFTLKTELEIVSDRAFRAPSALTVGDTDFPLNLKNEKFKNSKGSVYYTANFSMDITLEIIKELRQHNHFVLRLPIDDNTEYDVPVFAPEHPNPFTKRVYDIPGTGDIIWFREDNKLFKIVVRERNRTDDFGEKIKLRIAYIASRIAFKHRPIIMYEKESARYEESASVVYEALLDKGYKNVFFILDKNYIHRDKIPAKYTRNIVEKYSFKHYFEMFAAKSIISTESLGHALEVRADSQLFMRQVVEGKKNYVFLQHGVMYMVSLGSEQRKFFNRGDTKGKQRVVVSSALEARHFTDYTTYTDDDIYLTGLPKFDRNIRFENADRIIIMLTWRQWEYNAMVQDFETTKYYKFLEKIYNAVPQEYRDKVTVIPHPLLVKLAKNNTELEMMQKAVFDVKYDDILKETDILITDYSSIAYDAFYRGANVIFCWEELDECIINYGPSSRLMLTEDLAFGPVCYDSESIAKAIRNVYMKPQNENYLMNYAQIVEFKDGHNTDRVIKYLKKDHII